MHQALLTAAATLTTDSASSADRKAYRIYADRLQKGVHDLDAIHWLAGGATVRAATMGGLVVYGGITDRRQRSGELMTDWYDDGNWPPLSQRGLHPTTDVEDLSVVNLQLDNGVFAAYQQCHFTPDYWRNYTVIGTEGRLENFGDLDGAVIKVLNRRRSGYRADADHVIEVPADDESHGGADLTLMASSWRSCGTGEQVTPPFRRGRPVQRPGGRPIRGRVRRRRRHGWCPDRAGPERDGFEPAGSTERREQRG